MESSTMTSDDLPAIVGKITKIACLIEKAILTVAIFMGGLMAVVVIYGVIARYLVQNPSIWTEELARALMIWTAYLGISIALRRRGHLGILFFVLKLPIPIQRIVKLFNDSLIGIFLVVLVVYGLDFVSEGKEQIETATGITMNYPFSIIPICGVLSLIQLSLRMMIDFSLWGTTWSPFDSRLAYFKAS